MNRYMDLKWSWIESSHGMRATLLASLSDADLAFSPGGRNMSLGSLFREMGDIEYAYVQSLKTFTQDWSYHNTEAGLAGSGAQLGAWFTSLDDEMKTIVAAFSDDDLAKTIDRGGFATPVDMQLDVYLQALLIFFGKATVYLHAMERDLPAGWKDFVG